MIPRKNINNASNGDIEIGNDSNFWIALTASRNEEYMRALMWRPFSIKKPKKYIIFNGDSPNIYVLVGEKSIAVFTIYNKFVLAVIDTAIHLGGRGKGFRGATVLTHGGTLYTYENSDLINESPFKLTLSIPRLIYRLGDDDFVIIMSSTIRIYSLPFLVDCKYKFVSPISGGGAQNSMSSVGRDSASFTSYPYIITKTIIVSLTHASMISINEIFLRCFKKIKRNYKEKHRYEKGMWHIHTLNHLMTIGQKIYRLNYRKIV